MSAGSLIRQMLEGYLTQIFAVATRNKDGLEELIAAASLKEISDFLITACLACGRLSGRDDFLVKVQADVASLEAASESLPEFEAAQSRAVARGLRDVASLFERRGRGRPQATFGSPAGAMLQAAEDAHEASGQSDRFDELLANGTVGSAATKYEAAKQGRPSRAAESLISTLQAADPACTHADLAKAIRNARAKRRRKKKSPG